MVEKVCRHFARFITAADYYIGIPAFVNCSIDYSHYAFPPRRPTVFNLFRYYIIYVCTREGINIQIYSPIRRVSKFQSLHKKLFMKDLYFQLFIFIDIFIAFHSRFLSPHALTDRNNWSKNTFPLPPLIIIPSSSFKYAYIRIYTSLSCHDCRPLLEEKKKREKKKEKEKEARKRICRAA